MTDRDDRVEDLFARDRYTALLGMRLVSSRPVTVELPVEERHHNFHGMTHGAAVFSVADCAFALASNAAGDKAVGIDTHLVLTAATAAGDVLTAVAEETTRGRTLATYRVTVTRGDGRVCGVFTGTVHVTPASP